LRGQVGIGWKWRAAGCGVVAALTLLLLLLAGKASQLRGQALARTCAALEMHAASLPAGPRDNLRAALVCLGVLEAAPPRDPRALGAFMKAARAALADGQLSPQEANQLADLARQACGGSGP